MSELQSSGLYVSIYVTIMGITKLWTSKIQELMGLNELFICELTLNMNIY